MLRMTDETYQATLPTVAAGQAAVVARLRSLATRSEALRLDVAVEVLVFIGLAVEAFERRPRSRSNARPPAGSGSRGYRADC
jgi:hypothetical protein